MEIEVDYNPSPSEMYFISVGLNDKEAISFDYTVKGHRIIKQKLVETKEFPEDKKISSEWDVLVILDKKFVKKYHAKWIDMNKRDWVNNEIWETEWSKPISEDLENKLLNYSHLISDNYKYLEKFQKELTDFENLLSEEIAKYLKYE